MKKKRNKIHKHFISISSLTLLLLLWEGKVQKKNPGESILAYFHSRGFFKSTVIAFEPGKGMWHFVGWVGAALLVVMMVYSLRKRLSFMKRFGKLGYWLNTHIFLGLLGTALITAHTTLSFTGAVSIAFWSLIFTAVSGITGQYIYTKIPRNISGYKLELADLNYLLNETNKNLKRFPYIYDFINDITSRQQVDKQFFKERNIVWIVIFMLKRDLENIKVIKDLKAILKSHGEISYEDKEWLLKLSKEKIRNNGKINFLNISLKLFHHWRKFHIPLSIVMYIFMVIHVLVSYVFKAY